MKNLRLFSSQLKSRSSMGVVALTIAVTLVYLVIYWILGPWLWPSTNDYRLLDSTLPVDLTWQFQTADKIRDLPVIAEDGDIYVRADTNIYALDSENGQIRWKHQANGYVSGLILPPNTGLIIIVSDGEIKALHARDGSLVWQAPLKEFVQTQSQIGHPSVDYLFADSERIYAIINLRRGIQVSAFEPKIGQLLWKAPPELPNRRSVPYAAFIDREWIAVEEGDIFILDKETGEVIQQEEFPFESYRPPVYDNGFVYTSGEVVSAVDIDTMQEKWHFGHECSGWDQRIPYPPDIIKDVAYLLTTCHLAHAVSADNGQLIWSYEDDNEQSVRSFTVFQGIGYLLTQDATLHALDLETGREIGRMKADPQVVQSTIPKYLVAGQDTLLVRYGDHQLFAFRSSVESDDD
jgi:outer membrane protein assembly factor BamB